MSFVAAGSSSTSVWTTVLDVNFTTQPTQVLDADGDYVIGGYTFTKINSANETVGMVLTNGTGIVIQPAQATSLAGTTRTLPALTIGLSAIIPDYTFGTRTRVWLYVVTGNWSANYHATTLALEEPVAGSQFTSHKLYNAALKQQASGYVANSSQGDVLTSVALASRDVLLIELFRGILPGYGTHSVGTWLADWPDISTMLPAVGRILTRGYTLHNLQSYGLVSAWNVLFGAGRNAAVAAFSTTIGALRVDYTGPL